MAERPAARPALFRAFFALPNDHAGKTLGMALLVSVGCAVVVSSAAVALRPFQLRNAAALREASLRQALASVPGLEPVLVERAQIELHEVELGSGPAQAQLLRVDGRPVAVVLPLSGMGYQSMLRGHLVLEPDLSTVAALAIYEQAETPGVGSRVTDPAWLGSFRGKQLFDAAGALALSIVQAGAQGPHQVDGISGATRTTDGLRRALEQALGPSGFGSWLAALRREVR